MTNILRLRRGQLASKGVAFQGYYRYNRLMNNFKAEQRTIGCTFRGDATNPNDNGGPWFYAQTAINSICERTALTGGSFEVIEGGDRGLKVTLYYELPKH